MAKQSIAEIRKKEILSTFYEVAKVEGLENTSFAKIAQKLEIQPSLIVHYFKNRDELILALIRYNLDQYKQIFSIAHADDLSHQEHLNKVLDKLFSLDWNELYDDGVYYSCYTLIFRHPEIKGRFKDLHLELRSGLKTILEQCTKAGFLAIEDPAAVAHQVYNILDGTYYFVSMLDVKTDQEKYLQQSKTLAKKLIGLH